MATCFGKLTSSPATRSVYSGLKVKKTVHMNQTAKRQIEIATQLPNMIAVKTVKGLMNEQNDPNRVLERLN